MRCFDHKSIEKKSTELVVWKINELLVWQLVSLDFGWFLIPALLGLLVQHPGQQGTPALEQVNFNIHPQHNSLKNYLQLTRSDPLAAGFIRQKGATPKLEFPYEALRDRYEGKVFFHKRNRDNILLDPTNIPLYNKLPGVYRNELEEVPSDEYLYSNQYDKKMPKKQHYKSNRAGFQRKSYEPESIGGCKWKND